MKKKKIGGITVILVMIMMFFMTGFQLPANATGCHVPNNLQNYPELNLEEAQTLVAASEENLVRQAFIDETCTIRATLHESGEDCINNRGNNHVTVSLNATDQSYHVFDYTVPVPNSNISWYCTTP